MENLQKQKRIALIANDIAKDSPEALEAVLRDKYPKDLEVDIFDSTQVLFDKDAKNQPVLKTNEKGFFFMREESGAIKEVDPRGYDVVVRFIKANQPGDSEKSWRFQECFEKYGARPYIPVKSSQNVTDKILFKNATPAEMLVPLVAVGIEDARSDQEIKNAIVEALGTQSRYVVRMNVGSGRNSLTVVNSLDEALNTIKAYRNSPGKRGAVIHNLPPMMDDDVVQKFDLKEITDPKKRHYHFRVMMVDGMPFGASICYSPPGEFGLNIAQGTLPFRAIDEEKLSAETLALARRAADEHGLGRLATVDIMLDAQGQPRVLDMNASPNLSFTNFIGEGLKVDVAKSIRNMAMEKSVGAPQPRIAKVGRVGP